MLQPGGVGKDYVFNIDQEVFVGLKQSPPDDNRTEQMTSQQFAIRTADHANTIKAMLSAAFRAAGYRSQTWARRGRRADGHRGQLP